MTEQPTPEQVREDAAEIASKLTKAHGAALFGRYEWASPWDQDDGERDLYRLGLWEDRRTYRGDIIVTPLGVAVRDLLAHEGEK